MEVDELQQRSTSDDTLTAMFLTIHYFPMFFAAASFPYRSAERDFNGNMQQSELVLNGVETSSFTSIRRISQTTRIPQTTVRRVLHHDGLYRYHLQKVQQLFLEDLENRIRYCQWLQNNLEIKPHIRMRLNLQRMVFTRIHNKILKKNLHVGGSKPTLHNRS